MKGLAKDKREKAIIAALLVLSALASLTKLLIGFDIDEGYALAMPYRLLQGDWLFRQMWEIHQTSSLLPALVMLPFWKLTHSVRGMVLYVRIIALVIHLMMTVLVYRMLTEHEQPEKARRLCVWIPVLIYYNLLPKWMMSLDFSMQQLWGLTLICFCLWLERKYKKASVTILTGAALSLTVLGYIGMIVLYPAVLIWYLCIEQEEIKLRIKKAAVLTAACAVMALLFLALVFCKTDPARFLGSIPQIFADGTHSLGIADRVLLYARQWLNVAKQWAVFLAAGGAFAFLVCKAGKIKGVLYPLTAAVITVTSLLLIGGELVGIRMGPFHFQSRLLLIALLLCLTIGSEKKGLKQLLKDGSLYTQICYLSAVSFLGILLFSNVGPDSSSSYLSLMLTVLFAACLQTEHKAFEEGFTLAAAILFVLSVLFCKGFYVRYTEYFPANILQHREAVADGPQKGVYLLEEDLNTEREQRKAIESVTAKVGSAMLLGTDQILDLSMQCRCICPSTISTPAFNEQWITYLEDYETALPDVIFISKNTVDDREKFFSQNVFGKWIAERYDTDGMQENDSICWVYRKGV
ncbi:MAG: hypothetical protein K6E18_02170 [Lachnospiraceae bacterium]|nr:hypothetical protein [Lachnospiraceae bacterium]